MDLFEKRSVVRPGEHACSRFENRDDGERIAAAYVLDGIATGHKIVYLCDLDMAAFTARLASRDHRIQRALATGQLEIRPAREAYIPDGRFEVERTLEIVHEERTRALAEGFPALR